MGAKPKNLTKEQIRPYVRANGTLNSSAAARDLGVTPATLIKHARIHGFKIAPKGNLNKSREQLTNEKLKPFIRADGTLNLTAASEKLPVSRETLRQEAPKAGFKTKKIPWHKIELTKEQIQAHIKPDGTIHATHAAKALSITRASLFLHAEKHGVKIKRRKKPKK